MYQSLNDAQIIDSMFSKGNTIIWYLSDNKMITDLPNKLFFADDLVYDTDEIDMDNILSNHTILGHINKPINDLDDLGDIFHKLQGEYWSPKGEANSLILDNGMSHTSMMAGDIVETDTAYYVMSMFGFVVVNKI